jgi:sugar transferase (PEP-CTERM/EpsH1 system associated)
MSDLIFLAQRMPLPPEKGEDDRAWHMLCHLATDHRVHLGCFSDHPSDERHLAPLAEICASVMCVPFRPAAASIKSLAALVQGKPVSGAYFGNVRLTRWLAETIANHRPSYAFACGAAMAHYLEDYRFATRVIDLVEVASEKWRQRAETSHWPLNEFFWRQERALLTLETRVASRADHALFASAAEAHLFGRRAPRAPARVVAVRNGIDHGYFSPTQEFANPYPADRKTVVFAGAMDYPPNIEGATWFATEVMTMLRHRFPTIDFWIVGDHPVRAVRGLARRDIHVARHGGDVRPYLAHADAIIAPLRIARGTDNNVLEGMAMAKPVIATPAALDGLDLVIGEEVLCSASAPGFASGVATALSGRASEMGARARRRIETDYDWSAALRVLDNLFGQTVASVAGAP